MLLCVLASVCFVGSGCKSTPDEPPVVKLYRQVGGPFVTGTGNVDFDDSIKFFRTHPDVDGRFDEPCKGIDGNDLSMGMSVHICSAIGQAKFANSTAPGAGK